VGYLDVKVASEALHDGTVPLASTLSHEQVLGVMDKLLELELVMYRGGHNSLHTFHTMHYVHEPELLDVSDLLLYVRAAIFCASQVVELARSAEVAFEEDYIRVPMELSLDCGLPRNELLAQLVAAEQALNDKAKAGDSAALALKLRLALRRSLVELFLNCMEKPNHLETLHKGSQLVVTAVTKLAGQFQPQACPAACVESRISCRDMGMVHPPRAVPSLSGPDLEAELKAIMADISAGCAIRFTPSLLNDGLPSSSCFFLFFFFSWFEFLRSADCDRELEHHSLDDIYAFLVLYTLRQPCLIARSCLRRWLGVGDKLLLGEAGCFNWLSSSSFVVLLFSLRSS
jgi:hypothetical protein